MKKVLSLVLSLMLIMGLAVTVTSYADGTNPTEPKGSITIENPIEKQSYYIYRIFDLESYDKDKGAYSYVVNSDWVDFAKSQGIRGKYITLEEKGNTGIYYAKWIDGADVKAFAKLALEWAKDENNENHKIDWVNGITLTTTEPYTFSDLKLGYYLVDSSVGALCALTTTNPDATVKEKNQLSTVHKQVKEDSTSNYGRTNTAQIGDKVEFKSEITIGEGCENLVLHDVMDEMFDLDSTSFKLSVAGAEINKDNYTVSTTSLTDNKCTFEIKFKDSYTSTLAKGSVIVVEYAAILNDKAKISTDENTNKTYITFGDDLKSTTSTTKTYTYEVDFVKTDENGKVIKGAEFNLYNAATGGNAIQLVTVSEDETKGEYVYRIATASEIADGNVTKTTVVKAGKATIKGLDADTYYLEETKAPSGYNKLTERVTVDMTGGASNKATIADDGSLYGTYDEGGIRIINKAGTELPSTGGLGTTGMYIAGGIIVLLASVLIITRRRCNIEK